MQTSIFSLRLFLRIATIISLIAMFSAIITNSMIVSKGNEKIQNNQLDTLTHLLISQSAMTASDFINKDDQSSLLKLTKHIASDPLVYNASIYNLEGLRLASSSEESVQHMLGLNTPLRTESIGRQQLVEPIYKGKRQIGFMRITFEKGMVTAISDHHYRNSDHLMYIMLILSFISGVLLCLLILYKPSPKGENILLQDI